MKIRWTHRLRDYMAEADYFVEVSDAGSFCKIREAELVHEEATPAAATLAAGSRSSTRKRNAAAATSTSSTARKKAASKSVAPSRQCDPVFEDPPTFELFNQCYNRRETDYFLKTKSKAAMKYIRTSYLARPDFRVAETSFEAMVQEGHRFAVLWLTESVFISSIKFWIRYGDTGLADYQIALVPRNSLETTMFYVYSIPLMMISPPSLVAISFVASLCKQLPCDYFRYIIFGWFRNDIPPPLVRQLSIVPTSRPCAHKGTDGTDFTKILFSKKAWSSYIRYDFVTLEPQDIRAVLSYCGKNNLAVRLVLGLELNTAVNAALGESPHLRHVDIPAPLHWHEVDEGETPFTENGSIETISAFFDCSGTSVSPQLKGIVHNRGLKRAHVATWDGPECVDTLSFLFRAVFSGTSMLQEMIVVFVPSSFTSNNSRDGFDSVLTIVEGRSVADESKLCHVSVVRGNSDEPLDWPVPVFQEAMVNSASWDKLVSPHLTVNCYYDCLRNHQECENGSLDASASLLGKSATAGRLVPWSVRAVNLGIVYRKTTFNVPHDMSTANASVLYGLLHSHIVTK
jgi:hypothetical protein